jgi:hypothetical protein
MVSIIGMTYVSYYRLPKKGSAALT